MFFHKNEPEDKQPEEKRPVQGVPLLPLRDIVIFPHMVVPLFVGREKSIRALDDAMKRDKMIALVAQKKANTNDPKTEDLFEIGTLGSIVQLLRLPDGTVKVLIEGKRRLRIRSFVSENPFYLCDVENIVEPVQDNIETVALIRTVKAGLDLYAKFNKRITAESLVAVSSMDNPSTVADTVISHLSTVKVADRQNILEIIDPQVRLEALLKLIDSEIEIMRVERKIRSRVKKQLERTQKEYYLNEQMQAIQKELGEQDEFRGEIEELEQQLADKQLPEVARQKTEKEIRKLKLMQPMSAEATVVRNYVDWVLALPWLEKSEENYDIANAERVLEEDHYALEKPKERIIEYLAVQALVKKLKGPVLCFVGPPGVGKTSLARSIARATGREFVRLSLGGMRDEAEIRGHRRTYIGAMPGRLIQSLKRAQKNNPVFLLDEIDKMASDFRGDPAAALLEVLDPEQNHMFSDHYLDLDYDLSDVMFITTANTLHGIPLPLRDRMEILELSGYTEFEKLNIAQRYLIPRQRENAGLKEVPVEITEAAVRKVIHYYTMESGVRNLEREIGSICRKIARSVVKQRETASANASETATTTPQDTQAFRVDEADVGAFLGVMKYRPDKANEKDLVGLTHGLAVNHYGGSILECEVAAVPGKGKLHITGLLEKGMQESAQAAMSYIRSRQQVLGLEDGFHTKWDIHVHFPNFVPKDGPSAGITMATSIASALLKIPVRKNVAMTGEITLRGRVLAIGGLKEKLLAAHRAQIDTVLVPKENHKDLKEVPELVLNATRIVLVEHMDEVLREALCLSDPDALFAPNMVMPAQVIHGELVEPAKIEPPIQPTVEAPTTHQ